MVLREPVRVALGEAGDLLWRARRALLRAADEAGGTGAAPLCADLAETVEEIQTQVNALLRQPEGTRHTDTAGAGEGER